MVLSTNPIALVEYYHHIDNMLHQYNRQKGALHSLKQLAETGPGVADVHACLQGEERGPLRPRVRRLSRTMAAD